MIEEIKRYYSNGQLWLHYYKKENSKIHNKRHGEYKCYRRNGQLWQHWFYKNNQLHGERKEYYKDGKLRQHAIYADDKLLDIDPATLSNEDKLALKMKYDIEFLPNKPLDTSPL